MYSLRAVIILAAVSLSACVTTSTQVTQCPVGSSPPENTNKQVQFNDAGVMYQGQAFGGTPEVALSRATEAAEKARQDAAARASAYGYFSDCTSQGISVAVKTQQPAPQVPACDPGAQQCQKPCQSQDKTQPNYCGNLRQHEGIQQ